MHRRDLAHALRPVPALRHDVRHREIRPPARLIEVKAVLGKTRQINDAKIGTARRSITIIRRRLAQIIKTSPDKFTRHKWIFVLSFKFPFRRRRPRRRIEIIRTHLVIRHAPGLIVAYRIYIHAPRAGLHEAVSLPNNGSAAGFASRKSP